MARQGTPTDIHNGFLIVKHEDGTFSTYRSTSYYKDDIKTLKGYLTLSGIQDGIDIAGDFGNFTQDEFLQLVGGEQIDVSTLEAPEQEVHQWGTQPVVPKYLNYIMDKVRQHLGLEEGDTSRDAEINNMSPDTVFGHVLEWEGIIGYNYTIPGWIKDIYGVDLSLAEGFKHPQ